MKADRGTTLREALGAPAGTKTARFVPLSRRGVPADAPSLIMKVMTVASLRRFGTFLLSAFVLNFVWEMAQMPLYATRMTVGTCLAATGGDIALTLTALILASVLARDRRLVFWAIFAFLLLAAAASVEALALSTDRWSYAVGMPTVGGVGLVPLIQLPIVGGVSLRLARRNTAHRAGGLRGDT